MKKLLKTPLQILSTAALVLASVQTADLEACSNLLVTKGASKDGSTLMAYTADSHALYGALYFRPGGQHLPGTYREVVEWDTGKFLGRIPEAPVTYTRTGNMNEHQVVVGETTFGGRKELSGPSGLLDYGSLIYMALERAKTAREAIQVMTDLVAEHGYASSGESFSFSDKNEVWMMEMIGKGKGQKGAVWVAVKIPDGYVAAHANQARIRQFPLNDPQNCIYSKDVISFAKEKGWFKGSDKDFSFAETYAPLTFGALRGCEARVWSLFNRATKGQVSMDFVKAVPGAKPMPLYVKPAEKLDPRGVMALMRDHYEGTEFDMTQDVGAGPYKCPYRWRPMGFKVEGKDYVHERAISTQQTGWSYVSQSRSWLPDPIGGVLWFGVDDTATTCYFPVYCGTRSVPKHWGEDSGSMVSFNWDSAFWATNFVTNYAYSRWSDMIQDVQKVQGELEGRFMSEQPEIDAQALKLHQQSPGMARDFLTEYTCRQGVEVYTRYKKLGEHLVWKYLDGNVRRERSELAPPKFVPYSEDWYRRIVKERGEILEVKKVEGLAEDDH